MSFNFLGGLNKSKGQLGKRGTSFWSAISNLQNAAYSARVAGDSLQRTIKKDVAIRDAVAILQQAKRNFQRHGATEAAMAIFNQNNQLGQSLNISIPTVTSVNAAAVGKACCSKINSKIAETIKYAKHYGTTAATKSALLINKTNSLAEAQKSVLELLCNRVSNDIKVINAQRFGKSTVCGYARSVFMARVAALQYIVDNMHRCNTVEQCKKLFGKHFATLGWNVTDDGEVVETTPEEIAEQPETPPEEEVMAPVVDPVTQEPVTAEEEPELVTPPEGEEQEEVPPVVPQDRPVAVLGWTPNTIKQAGASLHSLASYVKKLANVYRNVIVSRRKLSTSVESYNKAMEKRPVLNTIDSCRKYSTFVGSFLVRYNNATTELVNQTLALYGILKDSETFAASKNAVAVSSITTKRPWGIKRSSVGFFNEGDEAAPEEDASSVPLPGELPDETEDGDGAETEATPAVGDDEVQPVESGDDVSGASALYFYDEDETTVDNNETSEGDLPAGDAEGEEDESGVALPGDLEDETTTEGGAETEATVPEGDEEVEPVTTEDDEEEETTPTNRWGFGNYFDEDAEPDTEETSDEGDEENEEESDEEDDKDKQEDEESEEFDDDDSSDDDRSDDDESDEEGNKEGKKNFFRSRYMSFAEGDESADDTEDTSDLPEGDAQGEEDVSGVPLPGDLTDDTNEDAETTASDATDYLFFDEGDEDATLTVGDDGTREDGEEDDEDTGDEVDTTGDEVADDGDVSDTEADNEVPEGLDTEPEQPDYDGDDEPAITAWWNTDEEESADDADTEDSDDDDESDDDDMIVGPATPEEFPTEPTETPDGVCPDGEVQIPEEQTEPYIQPQETPPEDIPSTTIDRYYFL